MELEINENELTAKLNKYLLELPNLIDSDLPIGGEENNSGEENYWDKWWMALSISGIVVLSRRIIKEAWIKSL